MSFNAILFVLIFISCGFFTFVSTAKVGVERNEKSGPFLSTIVRAEKCANPIQPYQKDLSADVTIQVYKMGKKNLLRGNYTAYKPDPGAKLTVQDYFLVNDQWLMTFRVVGMSCHSRIVAMMGHIFGIKFNKKTCSVLKGVYVFNNIDYDIVDHVFLINREYGRVLRKVEAFSKKGTIVCFEVEILITPKNK